MPSVVWLKGFLGPVLSELFRFLERLLPVRLLYAIAYPFAFARAFLEPQPFPDRWPACLGVDPFTTGTRHHQAIFQVNRLLEILADRLSSPRWKKRCQITGLDRLREICETGRPVMLAFSHFGPFTLISFWLRAHGIPATALKLGSADTRSRTLRHRDRYKAFPMIPSVLYLDQLREVVRVSSAGGVLVIAIDYPTGRLAEVPCGEDWSFRMATGAVRMATRHGADLIPCNIICKGPWSFRIDLGLPVPHELLTGEPDVPAAGEHLIEQSLPHWRRHPEQCAPELLESFQPLHSLAT